jgi:CDP-diglyceride synthetase
MRRNNDSFLHSENFKQRTITALALTVVLVLSLAVLDGVIFRVLFAFAWFIAIMELYAAEITLIIREAEIIRGGDVAVPMLYGGLILSVICICLLFSYEEIVITIVAAITTDVCAYLFGNALHDQFFSSRPFPKTSPKKSYEGIVGGVFSCELALLITYGVLHLQTTNRYIVILIAAPFAAVFGDWLESFVKRALKIKDSGDAFQNPGFRFLGFTNKLMAGHGGFLDRLDSIAAVTCLVFLTRYIS